VKGGRETGPQLFYGVDGFISKLIPWVCMFVKKSRKIAQSFVQYWLLEVILGLNMFK